MKINLFTVVGGVVLLGAGYFVAKHFGWIPSGTLVSGPQGYTDSSGHHLDYQLYKSQYPEQYQYQSPEQQRYSVNYNANVIPYGNDRINGPFTLAPSNTFHLSTGRPPG